MTNWLADRRVALVQTVASYCQLAPFDPEQAYPEWPGQRLGQVANPAYAAVRQLWINLGYDAANQGTAQWNPLGVVIQPGQTVILKPNLVAHRNHGERHEGIKDTDCLVTHGSVIRAVLDYVAKALGPAGRIIIGDCPIQGTSWEQVVKLVGLDHLAEYFTKTFPQLKLEITDYRLGRAVMSDSGIVQARIIDDSRRAEFHELDLGEQSLLLPLMQGKYQFGVSQYPRHRMQAAHTPTVNKYLLPWDFLRADVMINLPKMKSHMKAGITCAMKNFVGVNGHKDYLPHFRFLSPKHNGDEYPDGNWLWDLMWYCAHRDWDLDRGWRKKIWNTCSRFCSRILQLLGKCRAELAQGGGSWHGNKTLWRTILDINRAYFYFDPEAKQMLVTPNPRVKYLAILDGLVAGEKESPLSPSPIAAGIMLAAQNPVALDTVACALMQFDYRRLPQLAEAYAPMSLPLTNFSADEIQVVGAPGLESVAAIYKARAGQPFQPSFGYRGAVEYRDWT